MLDPKIQAEIDQGIQHMIDVFPTVLYRMFIAYKKEGFTDEQSMEFTKIQLYKMLGIEKS